MQKLSKRDIIGNGYGIQQDNLAKQVLQFNAAEKIRQGLGKDNVNLEIREETNKKTKQKSQ